MWIRRQIHNHIARLASTRPATILTGARQTGKTSLLREQFPDYGFVALDVPSEADQAQRDPDGFFLRHPAPVILDEVQHAPELFRHLKVLIDKDRAVAGRFLLTGSQKFQLMQHASESLAGRLGLVELETLSRPEIQSVHPEITLEENILRGGYPELHANPQILTRDFYSAYLASYLERDVRSLLNVSSLRDFERMIRACALRSGQLLNKSDLARDVGITPSTANQWLSVLQASNIVILLEPWFSNQTKSLVKSPKLYIADSGLLCHLAGVSSEASLLASPMWGSIWETFVFSELRKQQVNRAGFWSCHFWADRSREVDFLIHHGGRFELYEAKTTARPDSGDISALHYLIEHLGETNIIRAGVICRVANPYPLGSRVTAWPIGDVPASEM